MLRSAGSRFMIVGLLVLLMVVPLLFVGLVIDSRADYSSETIYTVGNEWGGAQVISGPQLVIPVEEEVTVFKKKPIIDAVTNVQKRDRNTGEIVYEAVPEIEIQTRPPVYVYPDKYDISLKSQSEERYRGIFKVPVYTADIDAKFNFSTDEVQNQITDKENLLWDKAEIRVYLSSNRSLRGHASLVAGDETFNLEPLQFGENRRNGIFAATGDPRDATEFELALTLNGAQELAVTPVGRESSVSFESDWPDPSFFGAFLPDESSIGEDGFTAQWTIPHLARALRQHTRQDYETSSRQEFAFGVNFFQPNDFYQKAYRAARYSILFIALTFLTVFLLDRSGAKPAHAVQYILIGLAQSVFLLLMVSYAEQIGFGPAYLLSSVATIGLLVMFGATGLKMGRRAWVLGALLIVLYAVLYLILNSTDYALMAGATLAFVALGGTMYLTKNEDWYGPAREKKVKGRASKVAASEAGAIEQDTGITPQGSE